MVFVRWSDSETLQFVRLYLKHECLWNTVHPGYKRKQRREKAHNDMIARFKAKTGISLSLAELANKIKNLRTSYSNEVSKILQLSRPGCPYKSSLKWFQEMDRCLKSVPGDRFAIYRQEQPEVSSSQQNWIKNGLQLNNLEEINPDLPPITQQTNTDNDNTKQNEYVIKIEVLRPPQCPTTLSPSQSTAEGTMKKDEYEIYGNFVASQLRTMNLDEAIRLQVQIQNLIVKARLADLHG